ncbi:MAG: hypothetical protein RIS35_771 [Pseudomonadota bacterium]|jgi:bacterioferritin (cytochrome b1)
MKGDAEVIAQLQAQPKNELTGILEDTEEHLDVFESQLQLIEQIGLQNSLQSQVGHEAG